MQNTPAFTQIASPNHPITSDFPVVGQTALPPPPPSNIELPEEMPASLAIPAQQAMLTLCNDNPDEEFQFRLLPPKLKNVPNWLDEAYDPLDNGQIQKNNPACLQAKEDALRLADAIGISLFPQNLTGTLSNIPARLHEANQRRAQGVYFTVCGGGRRRADITYVRAFFGEDDLHSHAEQWAKLRALGIVPTVVFRTDKSLHFYFAAAPGTTLEEYDSIQRMIVAAMGGDPAIIDRARIMRWPGEDHTSGDLAEGKVKRTRVEVIWFAPGLTYSASDMRAALYATGLTDDAVAAFWAKTSAERSAAADARKREKTLRKKERDVRRLRAGLPEVPPREKRTAGQRVKAVAPEITEQRQRLAARGHNYDVPPIWANALPGEEELYQTFTEICEIAGAYQQGENYTMRATCPVCEEERDSLVFDLTRKHIFISCHACGTAEMGDDERKAALTAILKELGDWTTQNLSLRGVPGVEKTQAKSKAVAAPPTEMKAPEAPEAGNAELLASLAAADELLPGVIAERIKQVERLQSENAILQKQLRTAFQDGNQIENRDELERKEDELYYDNPAPVIELPVPNDWPIIDEDAFYGLAGEYVNVIAPHTEADRAAMLVQLLTGFGNLIGRSAYFITDAHKQYTNTNIVLIGKSSRGRKGTSWRRAAAPLEGIDSIWRKDCVHTTALSSAEGLLELFKAPLLKGKPKSDTEPPPPPPDTRCLAVEEEFGQLLLRKERQGNAISSMLRTAFDYGVLENIIRKKERVEGVHISLIGHITVQELRALSADTDSVNGFYNRIAWFAARRVRIIKRETHPDFKQLTELQKRFAETLLRATHTQAMRRSALADAAWFALYPLLEREAGGSIVDSLAGRASTHVMRFAMIYALLDKSSVILVQHLRAATALWQYSYDSLRHHFGDTMEGWLASELYEILADAGSEGLTQTVIYNKFGRNISSAKIRAALYDLEKIGRAFSIREPQPTGQRGAPTTRWFARPARPTRPFKIAFEGLPTGEPLVPANEVALTQVENPLFTSSVREPAQVPLTEREGLNALNASLSDNGIHTEGKTEAGVDGSNASSSDNGLNSTEEI